MADKSTRSKAVLDCSRPGPWSFWFIVGCALALGVMHLQGVENWASLLRIGASNPLRAEIEKDLGRVISPDPIGHDGQIYYMIARDPFATGSTLDALIEFDNNPPRYRYRRILYPLLAGGFGQFGAKATLLGMVILTLVGVGLAAVAVADLSFQFVLPARATFLATFNIGALLSAMLLTADAFALGLTLAGLALAGRRRFNPALAVFVLAGLTKEVFLLMPLAVAAWYWRNSRREALRLAIAPLIVFGTWNAIVAFLVPGVAKHVGHLGLPMGGILGSVGYWVGMSDRNVVQLFLAFYAVSLLLGATLAFVTSRNGLMCYAMAPWILLAVCSTTAVWRVPGNAARAFAILWPLSVLLFADRLSGLRRSMSDGA